MFADFCEENGVLRHKTIRKTPQQNRVTERMNRTLLDKVRYMLHNLGLSKYLWVEAVKKACYLVNRLPSNCNRVKNPRRNMEWSAR